MRAALGKERFDCPGVLLVPPVESPKSAVARFRKEPLLLRMCCEEPCRPLSQSSGGPLPVWLPSAPLAEVSLPRCDGFRLSQAATLSMTDERRAGDR
jgi:hypothetical protein